MRRLATIGVYGFAVGSFLATLHEAGAGMVVDVRRRRGVRGSQYAWANSRRLQAALGDAGIAYTHRPELAPTADMLALQHREDERRGVGPRARAELAPHYRARYTREILDGVDLAEFVDSLPAGTVPALLCVERDARACHRSLIADRLEREFGVAVQHLAP